MLSPLLLLLAVVGTICSLQSCADAQTLLAPSRLRTQYFAPGEVAYGVPKESGAWVLSWQNNAPPGVKDITQMAYEVQILLASSGQAVWGSGRVDSDEQQVNPNISLAAWSDVTLAWEVRTYLAANGTVFPSATPWSTPLEFETAVDPQSWSDRGAEWVGGFGQLRSDFNISHTGSPIVRARAYVAGLGAFYLYINGLRVGDHVMDPPQTVYPQRVLYTTFDVTSALQIGFNGVGAFLGNYKWGYTDLWCNMTTAGGPDGCRTFILLIVVDFADGTHATHTSNTREWFGRASPILWDHLFHGETYDARQQLPGWASKPLASWPQGTWQPTISVIPPTSAPGPSIGPLAPSLMPPIRMLEDFPTASLWPVQHSDVEHCTPPSLGGVAFECEPQPACAQNVLTLACTNGDTIKDIAFASFGRPQGDCDQGFKADPTCDASQTLAIVKKLCVGQTSCNITANVATLGAGVDPCPNQQKHVAVLATGCSSAPVPPPPAAVSWMFDFGQNMAGFVTFHARLAGLPAGTRVQLEHAELLQPELDLQNTYCTPNANLQDLRHEPCAPHQTYGNGHETANRYIGDFNDANMTNIYIAAGPDVDDYTPFFAAAGFRFVRMTISPPARPQATWLTAHFVHTDVREVGSLSFAPVPAEGTGSLNTPDVLNGIHHLWRYSQLSNLWSIPTDCPQRERRGWMGDAQVSSDAAMFHFDMQPFYRKFLQDMLDDQTWGCQSTPGPSRCGNPDDAAGSLADVVPFDGIGGWPGCPIWQVAYIVIARNSWRHYGDLQMLQTHYKGLVALMDYFTRHASESSGLLETRCYGDWIDSSCDGAGYRTPPGAVTAFYYVYALELMGEVAAAIGNSADAATYAAQYAQAVANFHERYYNVAAGGYATVPVQAPHGSQTSNSLAIALGAPPDASVRDQVAASLKSDVISNNNHTTGGIVGMAWTFKALDTLGLADFGLSMLLQDTFPSFGRMLQQNATALCESWQCTTFDSGGGSLNHIMFGGFHSWFSTSLAGMDTSTNASVTGWRHIIVAPSPVAILRVGQAAISLETRFGLAAVSWIYNAQQQVLQFDSTSGLQINVTVPVGATAEVHFPPLGDRRVERVTELGPGKAVWIIANADMLRNGGEYVGLPAGVHAARRVEETSTVVLELGSGFYQLSAVYV